jgi:methylenetetrahydrofolate reductase (NADPH)
MMNKNNNLANFVGGYSIEVTPRALAKIDNLSDVLPSGTRVYIAHIEGTPLEEMVQAAKKIHDAGFKSMPHFPARLIKDKDTLEDWISRYQNEADVDEALLIAGGSNKPYGIFDSSIQLIETGLFDETGFKRLHVAGHPEGNKDIDPNGLRLNVNNALSWKNEFAKRTDAHMALTTQFCFESSVVVDWMSEIEAIGIDIPVHIGIAGPAKLQTLMRYAIECGVGASMKVLQKRAKDITKLLLPYKPNQILQELSEIKLSNPKFNIEQVHFFPLGGVKRVTDWINELSE